MTSVSPSLPPLGVTLERDPGRAPTPAPVSRRWGRRLLRVPLSIKLAGANVLLTAGTLGAAFLAHRLGAADLVVVALIAVLLGLTMLANFTLVRLALVPLVELERTAEHVWRGNFEARVQRSPLADRDLARVGQTLNRLLDGLISDRARLRRLAAELIRAGETERARIAHELHDSTAQTLAGLKLQLAALAANCEDPAERTQLARVSELAGIALEEVRTLALAVHPRVLDDLGLPAALEGLARDSRTPDGPAIAVEVDGDAELLPRDVAAVLYGVVREALANALRYAGARTITIRLTAGSVSATMEVADDGAGFDVPSVECRREGLGLFSMRERVALADGRFEVASVPREGTRVSAVVPYGVSRDS